jgi:tetratricopeptide (TPR) repeat protein
VSQPGRPPGAFFAPYVGSRFFSVEDHVLFHGRTREIGELAGLWSSHRLTILHGSAGAGKSSLLHAGAVPLLRGQGHGVLPVAHPGYRAPYPSAAVPRQNHFSLAVLASWLPGASPYRISELSICDFLLRQSKPRSMIAIDQAEILFRERRVHERDRRRFLDELASALSDHEDVRLVLSIRTDFLDEALRFARQVAEPARFELGPLSRDAAIEAVRRPALAAQWRLDPGVAERLVDEIGGDGDGSVEPTLLQAVCTRLLTHPGSNPDPMPDAVDTALSAHVAEEVAAIAADHRKPAVEILRLLRRAISERGRRLSGDPAQIRALEDHHLLKLERHRGGVRSAGLAHPRLDEPVRGLTEIKDPARSPQQILRAGHDALCRGEFGLARLHAETAMSSAPSMEIRIHAEAESMLGDIAYADGRVKVAIGHYQEAARLFEIVQDTAAVGWQFAAAGRLLLGCAEENPAAAVAELHAAADRVPNDPGVKAGLGQALLQAGEPQTALAVLGTALDLDGDTPEALQTRSEIFADRGDRESARSALRDLERVGQHARPSTELARALALATLAQPDAAKEVLETALPEVSGHGPALLRAARVEEILGDPKATMQLAQQAADAKDPPLPAHQRELALLLRNRP